MITGDKLWGMRRSGSVSFCLFIYPASFRFFSVSRIYRERTGWRTLAHSPAGRAFQSGPVRARFTIYRAPACTTLFGPALFRMVIATRSCFTVAARSREYFPNITPRSLPVSSVKRSNRLTPPSGMPQTPDLCDPVIFVSYNWNFLRLNRSGTRDLASKVLVRFVYRISIILQWID